MKTGIIFLLVFIACATGCVDEFDQPPSENHLKKHIKLAVDTVSAKTPQPKEQKPVDVAILRSFLKRLRKLSLPIIIQPMKDDFKDCPYVNVENDTVAAAVLGDMGVGLYGRLPDTSQYFAFITLVPADAYVPMLTVYSKTGKFMGSTALIVNGCTAGPDVLLCSVTGRINKDLSIFCVDSLKTVDIDEKYDPIPKTQKLYVKTLRGKLLPDGKLEMEEEKETISK